MFSVIMIYLKIYFVVKLFLARMENDKIGFLHI